MTLLITLMAAVIATAVWYKSSDNSMNLGILCFMYWGASIMWLVDAIFEYAELGAAFFTPEAVDMLNDTYLGLCAVVLGLVIWIAVLLIKDPKGKVQLTLKNLVKGSQKQKA